MTKVKRRQLGQPKCTRLHNIRRMREFESWCRKKDLATAKPGTTHYSTPYLHVANTHDYTEAEVITYYPVCCVEGGGGC